MQIRQLAVHYQPDADRLLLRIRSADEKLFAVWLTRRLCQRLWPHLSSMVRQIGAAQAVAQVAPHSTPTPQAASMLADAAREQALRQTDFSQPFDAPAAEQPFGAEPLLAHQVQLTPRLPGQLILSIADAQRRQVQLSLDERMATAVRELMLAALRQADWGLALEEAAAPANDAPADERVLN